MTLINTKILLTFIFVMNSKEIDLVKENANLKTIILMQRTQKTISQLKHLCETTPTYWLIILYELEKLQKELDEMECLMT